jgi:hypothetical protein
MSSGGAANPGASHTSLRTLALAALARNPPTLRLPPLLRDRYEAEHALPRALELRRATSAGVCIYVAGVLVVNSLVLRHPSWAAIAMQITVTPAASLLIASLFFRPDTPPLAREVAATVVACCFGLATVVAINGAPGENPNLGFVLACLPMFYVLAFVRLRFLATAAFISFSVLALTVALAVRGDISTLQLATTTSVMLASAALALLAVYRLHLRARRRYLEAMLQNLNPEDQSETTQPLPRGRA